MFEQFPIRNKIEIFSKCFRCNDSTDISPLSFVIHYRRYIDAQLQKTENEFNEHINRFRHLAGSRSQVQTIDFSVILKAFVRQGQH
jgi:hypothetical protein